jgi:hypothetical protein
MQRYQNGPQKDAVFAGLDSTGSNCESCEHGSELVDSWYRVIFQQFIIIKLVKKFCALMEPEGSPQCSQKPTVRLYPEVTESSQHLHIRLE